MSLQSKRELEVTRKKRQELEQLNAKTEADSSQSSYSRDLTLRSLRRTVNQLKEEKSLASKPTPALRPRTNDDGQPAELLADAVVHFNQAEKCWAAAIDWQALRHASAEGKLQRRTS